MSAPTRAEWRAALDRLLVAEVACILAERRRDAAKLAFLAYQPDLLPEEVKP